jgi:hypothetical protein
VLATAYWATSAQVVLPDGALCLPTVCHLLYKTKQHCAPKVAKECSRRTHIKPNKWAPRMRQKPDRARGAPEQRYALHHPQNTPRHAPKNMQRRLATARTAQARSRDADGTLRRGARKRPFSTKLPQRQTLKRT